nr:DUF2513 domain-containing protein [Pseudomonas viridiflava]
MSDFDWRPKRLTIRGHEFLDTIRDREVWRLTKAGAGAEKAGASAWPSCSKSARLTANRCSRIDWESICQNETVVPPVVCFVSPW